MHRGPDNPPPAPDRDRTVECPECRYLRRGLPIDEPCPECGAPAPPGEHRVWLRDDVLLGQHRALGLIIRSTIAIMILEVLAVAAANPRRPTAFLLIAQSVLVLLVVPQTGWWTFAAPRGVRDRRYRRRLRLVRGVTIAIMIGIVTLALAVLAELLDLVPTGLRQDVNPVVIGCVAGGVVVVGLYARIPLGFVAIKVVAEAIGAVRVVRACPPMDGAGCVLVVIGSPILGVIAWPFNETAAILLAIIAPGFVARVMLIRAAIMLRSALKRERADRAVR